ncbi:MAG: UPF0182 family protein [Clostridiales bacterium]|nr:UPF0182 family protein [Clostridiales bacterium]
MTRRGSIWGFLIAVLLLFIWATWFSRLYVDLLWFQSVNLPSVFWISLRSQWAVTLVAGLLFGFLTYLNLWFTRPALEELSQEIVPPEIHEWATARRLRFLLLLVALVVALISGLALGQEWLTVLRHLKGVPFGGEPDPVFGQDVGFYIFHLPFYELLYSSFVTLIFFNFLLAAGAYLVGGYIHFFSGRFQIHPRARAHLGFLVGLYFLLKAVGYWLSAYRLLFSTRGVAFGASYTDLHAMLPALRILSVVALLAALAAFYNLVRPGLRLLGGAVAALAVLSVALGNVWPYLLQEFVVKPNEIVRETPYIARNIAFTRRAFALDRIQQQFFPAELNLTAADVTLDNPTIQNVRLWDWEITDKIYQQLQGLRSYYRFDQMDVDRYVIGGELRQVLIAAREIDYNLLPGQTWVNLHLKYTHGYGVAASPAARVDRDGFPVFWVKDVPPVSEVPELTITRPEIYYGEQTNTYAIVNTAEDEFDYPKGESNAYTRYEGTGGVPVGSLFHRLVFALREQNYNILFSSSILPESRALIYRNVVERAQRIAPFLVYEKNPYIVVDQGRLFWILDAYTVSDSFPYSAPYDGINYIRNSVKVTVDAYNGDIRFYVAEDEPIIETYRRIFPDLFQPLSAMPESLRAHIRYPEYLFTLQGDAYARYHMTDPQVFYNSEDMWQVAREVSGTGGSQPVAPYYAILELPGADRPEFILLRPYTPLRRTNMVAWLGARSDGDHYGHMIAFLFPKEKTVLGPQQVESNINSTPEISQSLTLWNQQGSQVTRGNLLVIPIKDSILYVEPLYLQGADSPLPRLQRVIVAYASRVAMAPTLEEALALIFGGEGTLPPQEGLDQQANMLALVQRAQQLYTEAEEALRAGDFALYGAKIKELGVVLNRLQELAGSAPPPGQP